MATDIKSKRFVQGTHTSMVSAVGTATSLNIDVGEFVNAQTITLTSTGNNSGSTFTIVGTDANGDAATVTRAGPNANTVDVSGTFLTVTSISSDSSIATNISAGVKDGATTGTLFAGATRIRGMSGNGAAAGHINFKNGSQTGTAFHTEYVRNELIDPYIPDDGIRFPDGCFMQATSGAVEGLSIYFDG